MKIKKCSHCIPKLNIEVFKYKAIHLLFFFCSLCYQSCMNHPILSNSSACSVCQGFVCSTSSAPCSESFSQGEASLLLYHQPQVTPFPSLETDVTNWRKPLLHINNWIRFCITLQENDSHFQTENLTANATTAKSAVAPAGRPSQVHTTALSCSRYSAF